MELTIDREALVKENERLREALEFYANKRNWTSDHEVSDNGTMYHIIMYSDQEQVNEFKTYWEFGNI